MRSHFGFLIVTERSRMVLTIQQGIILNTFNRQSRRIKLDNILCASNFRLLKFLRLWSKPFSPDLCLQRFLLLAIGNKPLRLLLRTLNAFFVIASFFGFVLFCVAFFFFCYWVKLKICNSEFHQFYFLEKPQDCSLLQNCQFKCLHKIMELNQSANEF